MNRNRQLSLFELGFRSALRTPRTTTCCVLVLVTFGLVTDRRFVREAHASSPPTAALSPAESQAAIRLPEGYRVEVVAAEPFVRDPVAIAWDEHGRLWVVEMADYPYGMDGAGKPGGRVRYLTDRDGDGRYDMSTLFLDGLSFPTAVLPWKDGVFVAAAPQLIFARDTDTDGKADSIRVVFEGFVEGNQQLRVNGLRFGLDNWIHCASGGHHAGFGADNSILHVLSGALIPLGSRDFRFRAHDGELVPLSGPSQFGRVTDNWGNWFGVQNSHPLWHHVLEDRYLRRNALGQYPATRIQLRDRSNPKVFTAQAPQKRFHSYEQSGHFTSACGPCIYRDTILSLPSGAAAVYFTCEPFHNLVQMQAMYREGTSFRGERIGPADHDFFASTDRWCRPVMARTGPDGALWVVDMYRYMIEHPDWLTDEGRRELAPYYRAGEQYGRIYRVIPPKGTVPRETQIASMEPDELVTALASSNGVVRDLAQLRIVSEQHVNLERPLVSMAVKHASATARIHALGCLDGIGRLSAERLQDILSEESHEGVLCFAMQRAEGIPDPPDELVAALTALVADPRPPVRLQLALSLGEFSGPIATNALFQLAALDPHDTLIDAAIVSSLPQHAEGFVDRFADPSTLTMLSTDVQQAVVMLVARQPNLLAQLWRKILPRTIDASSIESTRVIAECLATLAARDLPAFSTKASAKRFRDCCDQAWRVIAATDQPDASEARLLTTCVQLVQHDARLHDEVAGAARCEQLVTLARSSRHDATQCRVVETLAAVDNESSWRGLLDAWNQLTSAARYSVIEAMLGRPARMTLFVDRLERGMIQANELSASQRARLMQLDRSDVVRRATAVLNMAVARRRSDVVDEYAQRLPSDGSAGNGRRLFDKHCAVCHGKHPDRSDAVDTNAPALVGPNLHSLTDRKSATLLTAILDPSRRVEPKYWHYVAELRSGQIVNGIIEGESGATLRMRQADGTLQLVPRDSIDELSTSRKSMMPDGFENELNPQDLADIISYVQQLSR